MGDFASPHPVNTLFYGHLVPATFFTTFAIWMTFTYANTNDNSRTPILNFRQSIYLLVGPMISNLIEIVSVPTGHTMFSTKERDCFRALSISDDFDNSRCPMGKSRRLRAKLICFCGVCRPSGWAMDSIHQSLGAHMHVLFICT